MMLPYNFQKRGFAEWNDLLRGLAALEQIAPLLGLDEWLANCVESGSEDRLVERLGRLGNDFLERLQREAALLG